MDQRQTDMQLLGNNIISDYQNRLQPTFASTTLGKLHMFTIYSHKSLVKYEGMQYNTNFYLSTIEFLLKAYLQ